MAYENETIVKIAILEKTAVDPNLSETTRERRISLHSKIPIPPYQGIANKSKFDVNWQWDL